MLSRLIKQQSLPWQFRQKHTRTAWTSSIFLKFTLTNQLKTKLTTYNETLITKHHHIYRYSHRIIVTVIYQVLRY